MIKKIVALVVLGLTGSSFALAGSTSYTTTASSGSSKTENYYLTVPSTVSFTTSWSAYGDAGGYFGIQGNGNIYWGYYGPGSGSTSGSGPAASYVIDQNASTGAGGYASVTTTATW